MTTRRIPATRARDVTAAERASRPAEVLKVVDPHGELVSVQPGELKATVRNWVAKCNRRSVDRSSRKQSPAAQIVDVVEEKVRRLELQEDAARSGGGRRRPGAGARRPGGRIPDPVWPRKSRSHSWRRCGLALSRPDATTPTAIGGCTVSGRRRPRRRSGPATMRRSKRWSSPGSTGRHEQNHR